MSIDWKKAFKTVGILVAFEAMSVFFRSSNKNFNHWLKSASDDELAEKYKYLRQQWAKNGYGGNGEKTPEMKLIDREMSSRAAEKQKSDPHCNRDPNYRWTDSNRWD